MDFLGDSSPANSLLKQEGIQQAEAGSEPEATVAIMTSETGFEPEPDVSKCTEVNV